MTNRSALLAAIAALGACNAPAPLTPSLAPRAAETIDPRVPVEASGVVRPADPALVALLEALVAQARAGDAAFRDAADAADRLVASAGPPQSEGWVVAQQAVSIAVAARGPTTRALGDIDGIAASALERQGGIAPADLAAIEAAAAEVGRIDSAQAARIDSMQARLGA